MITILCKNISVLMLRAGQLGVLIKYTSRLKGIIIVSNQTNLIRNSNKCWFCKARGLRLKLQDFGLVFRHCAQ